MNWRVKSQILVSANPTANTGAEEEEARVPVSRSQYYSVQEKYEEHLPSEHSDWVFGYDPPVGGTHLEP